MTKTFVLTACVALVSLSTTTAQESYTVFDDFSWAIKSFHLSTPEKQTEYDAHMHKCMDAAGPRFRDVCIGAEEERVMMNEFQPKAMKNFTETGFLKIKAPESLRRVLTDFWETNQDRQVEEPDAFSSLSNLWDSQWKFLDVGDSTLEGGGPELREKIVEAAQTTIEEWTHQRLQLGALYGIRIYHDKAVLAPHIDRIPRVSSAIINVAQDVDEPWPLEVFDHTGRAYNVTMEPGDMVLYESHSIIHGRPFPMKGRYFANIFIHFEPIGPLEEIPEGTKVERKDDEVPNYVVAGSDWERVYKWRAEETQRRNEDPRRYHREHLQGHPEDPNYLTHIGNFEMLERLVRERPDSVHNQDQNGFSPLHEAVKEGHLHIIDFLIHNGADVNAPTHEGIVPLWLAEHFYGSDHPIPNRLRELGAELAEPDL